MSTDSETETVVLENVSEVMEGLWVSYNLITHGLFSGFSLLYIAFNAQKNMEIKHFINNILKKLI